MQREYRTAIGYQCDQLIDRIETDVNNIIGIAEGINLADEAAVKDGIETIMADLKELADKLY